MLCGMGLALAGMTFVACDKDDEKGNEKVEGVLKRTELLTKDTTIATLSKYLLNVGDTICEFSYDKEAKKGILKFQQRRRKIH